MTIFEFKDYRYYLRAYMKTLPKAGRGEVNRLASYLRVHSSLVSQILAGTKDFSIEQAQTLTVYLGLNAIESDYFILLVQKARAGTHSLQKYFQQKLNSLKSQSLEISKRIPQDRTLTDFERSVFYSSWVYIAVWLFTSVAGAKSLEEICRRFDISRTRASEIISFLVATGLCKKKDERYSMGHRLVHVDRESPFAVIHHINWRVKAIQRTEDIAASELMFTAPVSISNEDFEILREQLVGFIKLASERVAKSTATNLACINLDLFWIRK